MVNYPSFNFSSTPAWASNFGVHTGVAASSPSFGASAPFSFGFNQSTTFNTPYAFGSASSVVSQPDYSAWLQAGASSPHSGSLSAADSYYSSPFFSGLTADSSGQSQRRLSAQQCGEEDGMMPMMMMILMLLLLGDESCETPACPPSSPPGAPPSSPPPAAPPSYPPPPATPPAPPPPTPKPPVYTPPTGPGGGYWGDPHFDAFDGGKFDVQGEAGKIYNIVSDSTVQVNAKFKQWKDIKGATVVEESGIMVGTQATGITKINYKAGGVPTVNGKALNKDETVFFKTGLVDKNGSHVLGQAHWDGTTFTVNTGEYQVQLKTTDDHLDQKTQITSLGIKSDGIDPHGLLGQTARLGRPKTDGKQGKGAQGEGAIEGVYTEYAVADIFGTGFKFNRFGQAFDDKNKAFDVLAGKLAGAA